MVYNLLQKKSVLIYIFYGIVYHKRCVLERISIELYYLGSIVQGNEGIAEYVVVTG